MPNLSKKYSDEFDEKIDINHPDIYELPIKTPIKDVLLDHTSLVEEDIKSHIATILAEFARKVGKYVVGQNEDVYPDLEPSVGGIRNDLRQQQREALDKLIKEFLG